MNFVEAIGRRMSPEDKRLLGEIYAPTEVAVPDADPGFCLLTHLGDGSLRMYGHYGKRHVFDAGEHRSYQESTDGGLSWKRHIVDDPDVLGASVCLPYYGVYLAAVRKEGMLTVEIGPHPDAPVEKRIPLGDFFEVTAILPVESVPGRVLIAAHEHRYDRHPTAFFQVILVTDDLEHFRLIHIPEAPFDKPTAPGVGTRWQQNCREGTLVEKRNGDISLLCRTATDFLYEAVSHDGGATFDGIHPTAHHAVGTMPKYLKLSDGRLLLFFCNTRSLPELPDADGVWEDVFTNRDAAHVAISEDDGEHWFGFRELRLNPLRCAPDFRTAGGNADVRDKSVHQFEAAELPEGKILVVNGQHPVCRCMLIFDPAWLYETARTEDFSAGLANLSTQVYIKSIVGDNPAKCAEELPKYPGHCAYNRISGALLLPTPGYGRNESLFLSRPDSPFLISPLTGAVWNFPAGQCGRVTLSVFLPGGGLRLSLLDHWRNPSDPTVAGEAPVSVVLTKDILGQNADNPSFAEVTFTFSCEKGSAVLSCAGYETALPLRTVPPYGFSYLHLQCAARETDLAGSYIASVAYTAE